MKGSHVILLVEDNPADVAITQRALREIGFPAELVVVRDGQEAIDCLLRQGEQGYQLTWMDAKVGDWVVTPRRGKAVEINALWYNALRLLEGWLRASGGDENAALEIAQHAERCQAAFNARFWNAAGIFAGSRSNPASMLIQRSRVGSSSAMLLRSPVKK